MNLDKYKSFPSDTVNGGLTIILPNLEEAIQLGYAASNTDNFYSTNDSYEQAVQSIYKPSNSTFLQKVEDAQESLVELVQYIEPSMKPAYEGFGDRKEDTGLAVDAGLLAAGEPAPFLDHKKSEYKVRPDKAGDGAYRILICTDVSWWGTPEMNCGIVGAYVTLLQQFRPVEVWIQQAWVNRERNTGVRSGVTLFKLEFSSGYTPQQIAFWVTSPYKDSPFSYRVNRALGRRYTGTSTVAEIECDLWLRGDWMKLEGMQWQQWENMLFTDKMDWVAKWIAKTAKQVAIIDDSEQRNANDPSEGGPRNGM